MKQKTISNAELFKQNKNYIELLLSKESSGNYYVKFFALLLKLKYSNNFSIVMGNSILSELITLISPKTKMIDTKDGFEKDKFELIAHSAMIIVLTKEESLLLDDFPSLQNDVYDFSAIFDGKLGKRISHIDMFNFNETSLDEIEKMFYSLIKIFSKPRKVVIYGAGTIAKLIYFLFPNDILAFCDINYKNLNLIDKEIPIIHPQEITDFNFDSIIISALGRETQIKSYLNSLNVPSENILNIVDNISRESVIDVSSIFSQLLQLVQDDELYYLSEKEINEDENLDRLIFNPSVHPKISIIIPVYNQFSFTYMTLKSLIDNVSYSNFEVIIVDDCSTEIKIQELEKKVENITILRNEQNMGFLRSCNYAVTFAKGEYIVLLNNDVLVQKNWLESLYETIIEDSSIGIIGSKFLFLDGRVQEAGGIVFEDGTATHYGRGDGFWNAHDVSYLKEVDYISGASIMLKKSLWKRVGGFDERYTPAYCEDVDLAFSVRKEGYKVIFQPKSTLIHFEGVSHGNNIEIGLKKYQVINQKKFFNKWETILKLEQEKKGENNYLNRDRSKGKEHIVIFDHLIPTFDQDAGSRTIWQYMKILKKLNFHITFIPFDFHFKTKYIEEMQDQGIEVLYPSFNVISIDDWHQYIARWLDKNGDYLDYTFILRPHVGEVFLPLCKEKTKAQVVFHIVDIHHLRMEREDTLSGSKESTNKMKLLEFDLIKHAHKVTTISEFEKQYIESEVKDTTVEVLPTFLYAEKFPLSLNTFTQRSNIMFVGGFNHTPNVDGVFWFIKEVFSKILDKNPDIHFYIVGSNPPPDILALESKNISVLGYVSDEKLETLYNNIRVCIAPLRYGAGVKGKIIESIAYGVPIVTTKIGAEGIMYMTEKSYILHETKLNEFSIKVIELLSNESLWNDTRENQISYATKYLNEDFGAETLKRLFTKV